ncbi:MAG: threonylcarbamoyl-AMP synthase [Flavobacteriales bacterium]|nr:threonylcarbamoyl-AMP synthase [Flavobacteriales bacterium]
MQEIINEAKAILKEGGIILYPTDTIWGIGCDATNPEAVEKIYQIKKRDPEKAMLVIIDDDRKLMRYVKEVPEVAWDILESNTEPLTIIYPQAMGLAKNLPAQNGSIGIRVCEHEFCKKLIQSYNKPLVSTSANFSGQPSPQKREDIPQELVDLMDFVVPSDIKAGGQKASGIIMLGVNGEVKVIRK